MWVRGLGGKLAVTHMPREKKGWRVLLLDNNRIRKRQSQILIINPRFYTRLKPLLNDLIRFLIFFLASSQVVNTNY